MVFPQDLERISPILEVISQILEVNWDSTEVHTPLLKCVLW